MSVPGSPHPVAAAAQSPAAGLPDGAPPRVWTLLRRGGVEERGPATRLGLARARALSGPLRLALLAARLVRRRGRDALRDLVRTAACRLAALDVLVLALPLGALDPTWRHGCLLLLWTRSRWADPRPLGMNGRLAAFLRKSPQN